MKKLISIALLATFFSVNSTLPTFAIAKAGKSCSKIGLTNVVGDKKFTCIKSGKKLIWDTGLTVINAKPSVSSTVTPAATPVPVASPTQSNISLVSLPDSWPLEKPADENLLLIADSSVRKYITGATKLPNINLMTGPTTDQASAINYLKFLEKAASGWSKDWMPDQVDIAMAQVDDYEWIKPLWKQYGLNGGGFDNSETSWRKLGANCNQGGAIFDKTPFIWKCLPKDSLDLIGLNKFGPHEYTHLVQFGIIYYESGKKIHNFPYLLSEGSADFYGVTYASTPETVKQNWKTYWADGYISPTAKSALKSASNEEIESLLLDAMKSGTQAPGHWYWTGAYVTARLVAAKGHEGFVAYMRKTGETGDPFKAFEAIYGITFERFTHLIAPELKALALNLRV